MLGAMSGAVRAIFYEIWLEDDREKERKKIEGQLN